MPGLGHVAACALQLDFTDFIHLKNSEKLKRMMTSRAETSAGTLVMTPGRVKCVPKLRISHAIFIIRNLLPL
uniref:hypothetical protein n=1 Tax=Neorhizobium vignae TaxID=690585 RepID=UPI001A9A3CE9